MAALTADQVRTTRAEGYRAGYALGAGRPNPSAPDHVPVWLGPRTPADHATAQHRDQPALLLARVWRVAYRAGLDAYARDRDMTRPSQVDD